jgi:thioredoxin reductase (NADPH)
MTNILDGNERKLADSIHKCTNFDIIIVGGGVAGLSAAIYAARDGFKTLVLEGTVESSVDAPGGALLLTSDIENFPGFLGGEGAELISIIRTQAENFGADIREERVENLEATLQAGGTHTITTTEGNIYSTRTIILATGAVARRLGIKGEDELYGRGVSTCATCDGFFYREKTVAVVGGGDTAIEDALLLTRYAKSVHLIVRGDTFRASGPEAREILTHPNVTILWNSTVEEVVATEEGNAVKHLLVKNKNGTTTELNVNGMFIAIGSDPATKFLKNSLIETDNDGYIQTIQNSTRVKGNIPGIFAAGDVADRVFRQAITSAGKAVEAALEARAYINTPITKET